MPQDVYWVGPVPTECDIGKSQGRVHRITTDFVDGKTRMGSWANMCMKCHKDFGCGLGTGRGQHYLNQGDGSWKKVAG